VRSAAFQPVSLAGSPGVRPLSDARLPKGPPWSKPAGARVRSQDGGRGGRLGGYVRRAVPPRAHRAQRWNPGRTEGGDPGRSPPPALAGIEPSQAALFGGVQSWQRRRDDGRGCVGGAGFSIAVCPVHQCRGVESFIYGEVDLIEERRLEPLV